MLSKTAAEKPDFSKLRPGAECRVELSVVDKRGGPSHVAYTGTVSRVQGNEVTLVEATRESGNEYGTPVEGRTPLANKSFKNRGLIDREKVGAISIPMNEIAAVEVRDSGARGSMAEVGPASLSGAPESAGRNRPDVSKLRPGADCQIRVAASGDRQPVEYYGKVVRAGENEVVLEDAYASGRTDYRLPAASRLPILNRLYKNTAVGREEVGSVAIPTSQIVAINEDAELRRAVAEREPPASKKD